MKFTLKFTLKFLFILVALTSCVSNKDVILLQGNVTGKNLQHHIYKAQSNDVLLIKVNTKTSELFSFFNNLTDSSGSTSVINPYNNGYRVDESGYIKLPYIGELMVRDLSLVEITKKIEVELSKLIKDPNSYLVSVKQGGIKFTIIGEVRSPGTHELMQYEANIIDAIANSGNFTEYGNRKNIEVIRQEKEGLKKYEVDITNANVFDSEVFLIKNNDIINIKPIKQKSIGIGTTGLAIFGTVISTLTIAISTLFLVNNPLK